ncbi:MAG: hypothetical protein AAF532_06065 [Planctomycetota bacterium]
MLETAEQNPQAAAGPMAFVDRREGNVGRDGGERRQFANGYAAERPEVRELGEAIDRYKASRRRRFITAAELYDVIAGLGYTKG